MNKSIFLLLYLVCTWSLIICTCCSDRGTAERNLIFSHFLCLQLFGLGTRKQEFKSTWTTGIWNFGIERILSGNHVMDCFFVCLFVCVKGIERLGSGNYRVDGWLVLAESSPGNWARIRSRLRMAQLWHQFSGNFDDVQPFPLSCVWICLKQQVGLWGIN